MKKMAVGETIQVVANLGVVAGIVFLALELSQNNELLEADARANQLQSRVSCTERMLDGVDLGAIEFKLANDESLTPLEEYRWYAFAINQLIQWEWQYREFQEGTLGQAELPVGGWRAVTHFNGKIPPVWLDAWTNYRRSTARSSEYVEYMDEDVFSQ